MLCSDSAVVEQDGNTALQYAARSAHSAPERASALYLQMARLLLAAKAAIDVQNNVRLPADGLMLVLTLLLWDRVGTQPFTSL